MRKSLVSSKFVALTTIVGLGLWSLPAPAGEPGAAVSGTIVGAADEAPLAGARLHVGDPGDGSTYASAPAGADGGFRIDGLPPSRYRLAVEVDGGLYLVATPLELAAGQSRTLRLAVQRSVAPAQVTPTPGLWSNPATATLIVLGSAIVMGLAIDQATEESTASPSGL